MSKFRVAGLNRVDDRRDQRRAEPSLAIDFEGRRYPAVDWSLGGFCIAPYVGTSLPGDRLSALLVAIVPGMPNRRHRADVEVVRIEPDTATLAARFIALDPSAVETLDGLLTGRLRRAALRKKGKR